MQLREKWTLLKIKTQHLLFGDINSFLKLDNNFDKIALI